MLMLVLCAAPSAAAELSSQDLLPPEAPWDGASRALAMSADAEWATPFEQSGLTDSPNYDDTVAWLQRLVKSSAQLEMMSLGKSREGRDVWMVIASSGGTTDPESLRRNGRPTVLAQAGIHSGEIDGKDAGMMLLRDMTIIGTKSDLLDRANFLFIPILNVDGHERSSRFSRINQRGPTEQGWRTNRRNLNLNRDYAKLDIPELRHVIRAIQRWQPDFYLDLHVTDGVDYQYDATYGYNGGHGWSPRISGWIDEFFKPHVDGLLREMGHVPGPLVFAANGMDMTNGNYVWTASPRFSNGYGDARQLPTVLLENHSLKSFDRRVLGTYVFLQGSLESVGANAEALRAAMAEDRDRRIDPVPVAWQVNGSAAADSMDFLGIRSYRDSSAIMGTEVVRWTAEPIEQRVVLVPASQAAATVARPARYYIPAAWANVAERLHWHGIQTQRVGERMVVECEMLRMPDAALDDSGENPYEGHARIAPGAAVVEQRSLVLQPGSYIVDTDQPLGTLAVLLLQPESPDSFFQWGFFLEMMQRTEYFEAYAIEPMAQQMLDQDPELRAAFETRLAEDEDFAGNPRARLEWFYEKSAYYDEEYRLYPVGIGR
jgi:murein tripeptide amidase MpaA